MNRPFPAYDGEEDFVFVCYSHADMSAVYREIAGLHANGVHVWYDEGIRPGSEWTDELANAIQRCTRFIFFVSPSSASSRHCRDEVQYALSHGKPIIVVYLEDTELPPGLALTLGTIQAVHLDNAKDDRYLAKIVESDASTTLGKPQPASSKPVKRAPALWAMLAAAVLAAGAGVWLAVRDPDAVQRPLPDKRSIALLPLRNVGGFAEDSYLPDSVSEDLLNRLVSIDGLTVISRRASFAARPTANTSLVAIAAKLGVRNVVTGTIRRDGDTLRLSIELVDVSSGREVSRWSDAYMLPMTALLSIQTDITRQIANEFFPQGLDRRSQDRLSRLSTDSPNAYENYLEGRELLVNPTENESTLGSAGELFARAIAEDPDFAWAHAGLCATRARQYERGGSFERARAACEHLIDYEEDFEVKLAVGDYLRLTGQPDKAIDTLSAAADLNPKSADARIGLARALADRFHASQNELDKARARTGFLEAIALEPEYWYTHHAYANFLVANTELRDALTQLRRALALKPSSVPTLNNIANVNYRLGNTEEAEKHWLQTLSIAGDNKYAHQGLGVMYHYAGDFEKAVSHLTRTVEATPGDFREWGRLGESERMIPGNDARAREVFETALKLGRAELEINPGNWQTNGFLAVYSAYLGNTDEAQQHLARMFALNPGNEPMTHYWALLVSWEAGEVEAAFAALDKALAYGFSQQKRFIEEEPALEPMRAAYPERLRAILERY